MTVTTASPALPGKAGLLRTGAQSVGHVDARVTQSISLLPSGTNRG